MQQKYFPLELKIPSKGNSSCLEPSPPADRVIKIYILLNKPSPLKFHATFRIASYILTSLPEIHRAAKPIRKFPSKTPIAERKKKKKKPRRNLLPRASANDAFNSWRRARPRSEEAVSNFPLG